jgi:hypothetical protein
VAALSMKKLEKYMQNQGKGQFTFDVFKAAYDADPRLKELVVNFDNTKIELKQSEVDDVTGAAADGAAATAADATAVTNMAKSATDVGAKL